MKKQNCYHYEYFAYTDNLNYGRMFLGRFYSLWLAQLAAESSNRGAWRVERRRVYDHSVCKRDTPARCVGIAGVDYLE
jgi:hypothetical protein